MKFDLKSILVGVVIGMVGTTSVFLLVGDVDIQTEIQIGEKTNEDNKDIVPALGQAYMEFVEPFKTEQTEEKHKDRVVDTLAFFNKIVKREEFISLPTIEEERFKKRGSYDGRFPSINDKFIAEKT